METIGTDLIDALVLLVVHHLVPQHGYEKGRRDQVEVGADGQGGQAALIGGFEGRPLVAALDVADARIEVLDVGIVVAPATPG